MPYTQLTLMHGTTLFLTPTARVVVGGACVDRLDVEEMPPPLLRRAPSLVDLGGDVRQRDRHARIWYYGRVSTRVKQHSHWDQCVKDMARLELDREASLLDDLK